MIFYAILSLHSQFVKPKNEAVLAIDAKHALNYIKRNLVVENMRSICPALSFVVQNPFSAPSDKHFASKTRQSLKSKTQGDHVYMAMDGVTTLSSLRLVLIEQMFPK